MSLFRDDKIDYIKLKDAAIEELRKRKLEETKKQYPNKRVFVSKDMQVFVEK